MAYDFFSQPQGPNIDVNLFGNSALQGARLGKETPSALNSALTGLTEGVKTGLDLYGKYEQNQGQDLENQAKQLQLERDKQNQELQLQDDTAKLKNDVSKQNDELQTRQEETNFTDEFSALQGNPTAQADLVLSGKYGGVLSKNQNLYKQSLQQVYPALSPDQKIGVDKFFAKSSASNFYDKQALLRQQKFEDAKNGALNDSLTAELQASGNLSEATPEEYPSKGMFKLSGAYVVDPSTNSVAIDPTTHQWQVNKSFDPKAASNTYDYIAPDGRVLAQNVAASSKKAYEGVHLEKGYVDGRYKDIAVNNAVNAVSSPNGSAPSQLTSPVQNSPITSFTAPKKAGADPFIESFKSDFRLSDTQVSKLSTPVKNLEGILTKYVSDAKVRNDPSITAAISHSIHTIAHTITDDEFDSSEATQSQNTQAQVDAYNKGIYDQLSSSMQGASKEGIAMLDSIYKAAKLNSPKDLFYMKQGSYLENKTQSFINKTIMQLQSKSNSVFKGVAASQANINNLTSIANGG